MKSKISKSIQTGYHCTNCDFENTSHGSDVLVSCGNCGVAALRKIWRKLITTVTTVEDV